MSDPVDEAREQMVSAVCAHCPACQEGYTILRPHICPELAAAADAYALAVLDEIVSEGLALHRDKVTTAVGCWAGCPYCKADALREKLGGKSHE